MTLPHERTRAVSGMEDAVKALYPYMAGDTDTVRVPRELLRNLGGWMRHYPTGLDLAESARKCPEIWGSEPTGFDAKQMTAGVVQINQGIVK